MLEHHVRVIEYDGTTRLIAPLLLAVTDELIIVYDYGDRQLKTYGWGGQGIWTRGGYDDDEGLQFVNPTDLSIDVEGNVLLADPPAKTLLMLAPGSGSVVRRYEVDFRINRAVGVKRERWLVAGNSDHFLMELRPDGSLMPSPIVPTVAEGLAPFIWEPQLAADPVGGTVVVGLLYSHVLAAGQIEGGAILREWPGVEPVPQARLLSWHSGGELVRRLHPESVMATLDVSLHDNRVYVLFEGTSANKKQIVDVYHATTTEYVGSLRFPFRLNRVEVTDNGIVTVAAEPRPRIDIWQAPPFHSEVGQ